MKKFLKFGLFALIFIATALISKSIFAVAGVSAAALITPGDITFNGQEVRSMSEVIIEDAYQNPSLNEFHTIVENIVAKEQIAYLGTLSKMTKADAGCGTGKQTINIPADEKFWEPEKVKVWISECIDDIDATFMIYLKNKGVKESDWTGTDIVDFIVKRVTEAMDEDILRIAWFNDKNAANVDDSVPGVITSGVSLTDYTIIDGFWKQIFAICSTTPARLISVAKNAESTYADQAFDSSDTSSKVVTGIFSDLLKKADPRLKARADKIIICTTSMAEQYLDELEAAGVPASFDMVQNGVSVLKRRGVTIYAFDFWDRTILADFDSGTALYRPHRALLTTKENLQIGLDAMSSMSQWSMYYDEDDETNNIKAKYKIDAKIVVDHMIQAAY